MRFQLKSLLLIIPLLCLTTGDVFAHQPRMVESTNITVTDPEISKAYYGKLEGAPDFYHISATKPFDLYINILVPDIAGQKKEVSAVLLKNDAVVAKLDGPNFEWKLLFEPFGHDNYLMGPEYKATAEAGEYEITVSSPHNDSKYSLAIGEIEKFDFKESLNAISLIPKIKSDFFNKSPWDFIFSPFGFGFIIIMYILGAAAGFTYRALMKKFSKNTQRRSTKNIGTPDRLVRIAIGIALLLWAITTTWSPLLLFFSGFTLFEGIFSWCGFYAAIGKNSCPIN